MLRSERSLRKEKETGKEEPAGERLTGLPGSAGRKRTRRAAEQNAEEMELPMEHGRAGSFHEENFRRRSRYTLVFVLLAAAFCAIIILNINTGNVNIPLGRILQIIFTRSGSVDEVNIVWKIRLPRILMSAILGGALALSGFLLQTFFENPIAGPFVLGISSGAKMAVAIVIS